MGQAKCRGSFSERRKEALDRKSRAHQETLDAGRWSVGLEDQALMRRLLGAGTIFGIQPPLAASPLPRLGEGVRCPDTQEAGSDIVGCGSSNVSGPDDEGFYDCGECGLFFKAASSAA